MTIRKRASTTRGARRLLNVCLQRTRRPTNTRRLVALSSEHCAAADKRTTNSGEERAGGKKKARCRTTTDEQRTAPHRLGGGGGGVGVERRWRKTNAGGGRGADDNERRRCRYAVTLASSENVRRNRTTARAGRLAKREKYSWHYEHCCQHAGGRRQLQLPLPRALPRYSTTLPNTDARERVFVHQFSASRSKRIS